MYKGLAIRTYDSIVFRSSFIMPLIKRLSEQGKETWLFGDSGYALRSYMIVPYRQNANLSDEEQLFNDVHAKIRNRVERALGVLKSRWR